MKTNRSIESGQLPKYMAKARGADRSFMQHGKCRRGVATLPMEAWTREAKDPDLQGVPASAWIGLAAKVCESCPVQYDCVRFAIQIDERWGTWGIVIEDLQWLKREPHAEQIVDIAEDTRVSVAEIVRRARGLKT